MERLWGLQRDVRAGDASEATPLHFWPLQESSGRLHWVLLPMAVKMMLGVKKGPLRCQLDECPPPCMLSPWSHWSLCTRSCGG